jgi:hypothetical protein
MNTTVLYRMPLVGVILLTLTCVSCFDRTEEITVDPDGTTTIVAEFKGDESGFRPPVALPSEPEWTILRREIDSSDTGSIKIELEAKLVMPYGTPLPSTYARPDAANRDVNLQFPTEVRYWTEGKRTFYEFTRTYVARKYDCYHYAEKVAWDQELENRVLEKGIFEVSEEDRAKYLDQFGAAFGYVHWRFLWETLGALIRRGEIAASTGTDIETWAASYIESVVTPVRMLGIAGKDDDSIGEELDRLKEELHHQFTRYFSSVVGPDRAEAQRSYTELFQMVTLDYDVTEALGSHDFGVGLNLPGKVIETNGHIDPEELATVQWYFEGEDLHDKDIRLYALSVVES